MSHLDEEKRPGCYLLTELPGTLSRDVVTVTVAASTTLNPGAVLGKITATKKYVPVLNGPTPAADGSQNAAAVLYAKIENAGLAPADFSGVVTDFGAEVALDQLEWNGSDVTEGRLDLAAAAIKVRD